MGRPALNPIDLVSEAFIALFIAVWTLLVLRLFVRRKRGHDLDLVWGLTVAGLIFYTVASVIDFYDEFRWLSQPVKAFKGAAFTLAAVLTGIGIVLWARKSDQLIRRLEHEASTDFLTGVPNRRSLFETLGEMVQGAPFCLLLLDLDRFKLVNDLRGHIQGDRVLADFAAGAKKVIRRNDAVFRYGGDEFVVVLADTGRSDVGLVIERLRAEAARLGEIDGLSLGLSIGVASCPEDGDTPDKLLAAADSHLYQAKGNGNSNGATAQGSGR